jgi:hypothetical protein
MDAPADAWIAFSGVSLVTFAMTGIVMSIPTVPPPDAKAASNAINDVAGSPYGEVVEYEHSAEEVQLSAKQFGLRNSGGTVYGSISFGTMTPVGASDGQRLTAVLSGKPWEEVFDSEEEFLTIVRSARQTATYQEKWRPASGTLRARKILVGATHVTLVKF